MTIRISSLALGLSMIAFALGVILLMIVHVYAAIGGCNAKGLKLARVGFTQTWCYGTVNGVEYVVRLREGE